MIAFGNWPANPPVSLTRRNSVPEDGPETKRPPEGGPAVSLFLLHRVIAGLLGRLLGLLHRLLAHRVLGHGVATCRGRGPGLVLGKSGRRDQSGRREKGESGGSDDQFAHAKSLRRVFLPAQHNGTRAIQVPSRRSVIREGPSHPNVVFALAGAQPAIRGEPLSEP